MPVRSFDALCRGCPSLFWFCLTSLQSPSLPAGLAPGGASLPFTLPHYLQALHQVEPRAGQRVLITAAAGGVGHIAVQVSRPLGYFRVLGCVCRVF